MIVQACINGARDVDFHPALPLTVEASARDGASWVAAGAAELHVHSRGLDGRESLAAATMNATVLAVRRACPGTLIGVSTGEWIEGDECRTLASIDAWDELPDYASVNLGEPTAPAVMEKLRQRGIGIEAGLASIADVERLVKLDIGKRALRILIEISLSRTLATRSPSLTALLRRWTAPRCDGPSSCMASRPRSGTSLRSRRIGVGLPE